MSKALYYPPEFTPDCLSEESKPYFEEAAYLLHIPYTKRVRVGDSKLDWQNLRAEIYRRPFPNTDIYKAVIAEMLDKGLLERRSYIKGKRSFGFRIGEPLRDLTFRRHEINGRRLKKALSREPKLDAPFLEKMKSYVKELRLSVGFDEAFALCADPKNKDVADYWDLVINDLLDGNHHFTRDFLGRVHTLLTSLPRELRRYLVVNGKSLWQIDIRNSQPLFFVVAMLKKIKSFLNSVGTNGNVEFSLAKECRVKYLNGYCDNQDVNRSSMCQQPASTKRPSSKQYVYDASFKLYQEHCERGTLYDFLMQIYFGRKTFTEDERRDFKEKMFAAVFFCDNDTIIKEYLDLFGAFFPTVLGQLQELKESDYRHAAHAMQKAESDLVINQVARRICETLPNWFATIHDSILCHEDSLEPIYQIFADEFRRLGIYPTFKFENLADPSRCFTRKVSRPSTMEKLIDYRDSRRLSDQLRV